MFPNFQSKAAWKRKRMYDACQTIMQSASALNFLHEVIEPPNRTEKLELSTSARDGLACNLKLIATTIYDSLDLIPDTESSFHALLDPKGGENV